MQPHAAGGRHGARRHRPRCPQKPQARSVHATVNAAHEMCELARQGTLDAPTRHNLLPQPHSPPGARLVDISVSRPSMQALLRPGSCATGMASSDHALCWAGRAGREGGRAASRRAPVPPPIRISGMFCGFPPGLAPRGLLQARQSHRRASSQAPRASARLRRGRSRRHCVPPPQPGLFHS